MKIHDDPGKDPKPVTPTLPPRLVCGPRRAKPARAAVPTLTSGQGSPQRKGRLSWDVEGPPPPSPRSHGPISAKIHWGSADASSSRDLSGRSLLSGLSAHLRSNVWSKMILGPDGLKGHGFMNCRHWWPGGVA